MILPTREKDDELNLSPGYKMSVWQEKDHYVLTLDLKDKNRIIISGLGKYKDQIKSDLVQVVFAELLKKYV